MKEYGFDELSARLIVNQDYEHPGLDHLQVDVFDEEDRFSAEMDGRFAAPLATFDIKRVIGDGSQRSLIEVADSQSQDFLLAAKSVMNQAGNLSETQELSYALGMSERQVNTADTLLYLDAVKLAEAFRPELVSKLLSCALRCASKGLRENGWIAVTYSVRTASINQGPDYVPEPGVRFWYGGETAHGAFQAALITAGFRPAPIDRHVPHQRIFAIASPGLRLRYGPAPVPEVVVRKNKLGI